VAGVAATAGSTEACIAVPVASSFCASSVNGFVVAGRVTSEGAMRVCPCAAKGTRPGYSPTCSLTIMFHFNKKSKAEAAPLDYQTFVW
jgi:hypothetical protein